ncbi:MAG TPA: hypothetical protein DCM86_05900 [Verrucomicrobiales bacterium]|nr:hypothetical protein [Verrucomicrobiales bacterium]
MRALTFCLVLLGFSMLPAPAATIPHYINSSPFVGISNAIPQIDAVAFENRSLFEIFASVSSVDFFSPIARPFETYNTVNFTNTASGTMYGYPGFIFDTTYNTGVRRMGNWVNRGYIYGDVWMIIDATNIVNAGQGISTSMRGAIQMSGDNVNLSRSGLFTGGQEVGYSPYVSLHTRTNAFDEVTGELNVVDIYWGMGTNKVTLPLGISTPSVVSPRHTVQSRWGSFGGVNGFNNFQFGGTYNLTLTIPFGSLFGSLNTDNFGNYTVATYTNRIAETNFIHVVFYPTNSVTNGIFTTVTFPQNLNIQNATQIDNPGHTALVQFSSSYYDPTTLTTVTNYAFLEDDGAWLTNRFLAHNVSSATLRANQTQIPNTLLLTRESFLASETTFAAAAGYTNNFAFSPALFDSTDYVTNNPSIGYAAYRGSLTVGQNLYGGYTNAIPVGPRGLAGLPIDDITNYTGRVVIDAKKLNLDQVRVRAETAVIIHTDDLVGNKAPIIDAPLLSYDLKSTQPTLVVSNLVSRNASRLIGDVGAYSAQWVNTSTNGGSTNTYYFSMLIVDPYLTVTQGVVLQDLKLRGTNVVLHDTFNVGRSFVIDAKALTVTGSVTNGLNRDINAQSFLSVINFTNYGSLYASRDLNLGADRTTPYSNIVNYGTIDGGGVTLAADQFLNQSNVYAGYGSFAAYARSMRFLGSNSIYAYGDVILNAKDLYATNSVIYAGTSSSFGGGGMLVLNVTNSLSDGGVAASNTWYVTDGFSIAGKTLHGDLLGTTIYSTVAKFNEAVHYSEAHDAGVNPEGYTDNVAVGHLVLDGADFSSFRFSPSPGTTGRALYVDYLDLRNNATNYDDAITVDEGCVLYFANANISPKKLNHISNDRVRWVSTYAGPLSSTNVVYPGNITNVLNVALVTSSDLDSDNDGIANVNDPTPVWTAADINLSITLTNISKHIQVPLLSWNALNSVDSLGFQNYVTNSLEFVPDANHTVWTTLTNFTSPLAPPQWFTNHYLDRLGTNRLYRVRVHVQDP